MDESKKKQFEWANRPQSGAEQKATPAPSPTPAVQLKKGVVAVKSLRIRKDHDTKSDMVGGLVLGDEVTVLGTWTDGKNTWAKLGPDQWAAMVYDGETYIKLNQ